MKTLRDIPFSNIDPDLTLDLYLPDPSASPAPLVVFIHGGGFFMGDKTDSRGVDTGSLMTESGYACASINYTLAPREDKFAKWPRNICDVADALIFLSTRGDEYSFDFSRFAVMGCSAGGTLAALYAFGGDALFNHIAYSVQTFRPRALISMYGPFNFLTRPRDRRSGNEMRDRDISPAYWLELADNAMCPPAMHIQGDLDKLVRPAQHEEFREAYTKRGLTVELIRIPNFGHAFRLRDTNSRGEKIDLGPPVLRFLGQYLGPASR